MIVFQLVMLSCELELAGILYRTKTMNNTTKLLTTRLRNLFSCQRTIKTISCVKSAEVNTASNDGEKVTHFGYETVKAEEKAKKVYSVFETVANSYDLMNDLMSGGIHRIWKDIFISELGPTHGSKLLDAAGGTGDIAFRYLKYLQNAKNPKGLKSHVTVFDINENMLEVGKVRAERQGFTVENGYDIAWQQGNAESAPFADDSFTAYTIAFGIRNVTHIDKVLSEAYRVLQPGGRFLCLEFSHVNNDLIRSIYDKYSFEIIPVMGTLVAGSMQPYHYLVQSIRRFPKQDDFAEMISEAGFRQVTYTNYTFGTVAIHSGFKL